MLYVLGDLDLLCLEEDTSPSACTCEVWNRMVQRDPAGTEGMKPPEVCLYTASYVANYYIHIDAVNKRVWHCITSFIDHMIQIFVGQSDTEY